jgi:hypothetical protein
MRNVVLVKCPFCKTLPYFSDGRPCMTQDGNWHYVFCPSCQTEGPVDLGESGAIEAWNMRPEEDALLAEIAKLKELINKK